MCIPVTIKQKSNNILICIVKYRVGSFDISQPAISEDALPTALGRGSVDPHETPAGRPPHEEAAPAELEDHDQDGVEAGPGRIPGRIPG